MYYFFLSNCFTDCNLYTSCYPLQGAECDELLLLYIGTLEYTSYIFTIHFYELEDITAKVTDLDFYVSKKRNCD